MLSGFEIALAGLAALAAGFINALAGGGTLVSFPALIVLGYPELLQTLPTRLPCVRGISEAHWPSGRICRDSQNACGF